VRALAFGLLLAACSSHMVVADFNEDGKPDVAVTIYQQPCLNVLLNIH
jgi:hypothetical protein